MPPERPDPVPRPARPRADGAGPPVATLREAVRELVARTSLRVVADDIGMSSSGLHSFLNGGRPYARTVRLLATWFVRRHTAIGAAAAVDDEQHAAAAAAAIALLVAHLPPSARAGAARQLMATVRALTDEARVPSPAWLGTDGPAE
jgi:hypothetical protein